jgi:hypothetical protein
MRREERSMKRAYILLIGILSISACVSYMTLMVNPNTGQYAECRAGMYQTGSGALLPLDQWQRTSCVEQYEAAGFVQVQNLTPEQRDSLAAKPTR